jgi:uncharacterized protein (DUF433 family)
MRLILSSQNRQDSHEGEVPLRPFDFTRDTRSLRKAQGLRQDFLLRAMRSFLLANSAHIQYDSIEIMKNREVAALKFNRITINPRQMGGVPCIRGLRIPVATVVGMVAEGMTAEEILRSFPDLERDDIKESLQYAAEALRERELPLAVGS